jgi:nitrite reductase/ring-hydroxylating ferredoxin subunit
MSGYVRVAAKSELPAPGEAREFSVGEKVICIANVNGKLAAMDNLCLHRGGSLGQGCVEHGKVICPWHGWRWDPVTGAATEDPNLQLKVYELRLAGDDVLVKV